MIVVKLGGAALRHTLSDPSVTEAIARRSQPLVIVHGGGPEINRTCERLGLDARFVDGQRVTSPEVFEVVEMALARIGNALVRSFDRQGRLALALNGQSLGLFRCDDENLALGRVGRIRELNASPIEACLAKGWIPVVAPLGILVAGSQAPGEGCNINADLAAAALAARLGADRLVFFTDRDGILDAQGGLIRDLSIADLEALASSPTISGGMKVKARAILETLAARPGCQVQVVNGTDLDLFEQALDGRGFGTTITSRKS